MEGERGGVRERDRRGMRERMRVRNCLVSASERGICSS